MKQIGQVHPERTMFLRQSVGTANAGKLEYNMATQVPKGCPIIQSRQTGKWFMLSWRDIIDLAVKAGIDR